MITPVYNFINDILADRFRYFSQTWQKISARECHHRSNHICNLCNYLCQKKRNRPITFYTNPPYADANYHCMIERLSQIAEKWGFWSLISGIMKRLTVFPLLSNHYSTEYKKQRTGGTT